MIATRTKVKPPLDTSVSFSEIARGSFVAQIGWTPLSSAYPVAYYVLYRDGEELATSITATTYRDLTIVEDSSTVYTVATVNSNLIEGGPSTGAGLLVPGYPVWQDFALSMNQGVTQDISGNAADPQDRSLTYSRQGGTAPAAVTVSSAGVVSSGTATGGIYTLGVRAANSRLYTDTTISMAVVATLQPSVPVSVAAAGTSLTNVRVTWDAGSGGSTVVSYRIYRAAEQNGTFALRNTVTAPTELLDDAVPSGETRWYRVSAFDGVNESALSSPQVSGTGTDVSAGFEFNDGFESASIPTSLYNVTPNGAGTTESSTTHAREGGRSLHTKITKSGTTNYRQEVRVKSQDQTNGLTMTGSEDYWLGFSVYIPTAASLTPTRVIQQWNTKDFGSGYSPVIALRIRQGNFEVAGHDYPSPVPFGAVTKEVWHDFVWRIRWRSQTPTGITQLYWNGALVHTRQDATNGNPAEPGDLIHHVKCGNYAGQWDSANDNTANGTIVEAYHDCIRIAMGTDLYDLVAPQGNRLTAP